jgi:vacuolar protein sorting-associated protein 13A/C
MLEENTVERMRQDLALAAKPLKEHATAAVSLGRKDFYDYLHFSPLKLHVSFSLTSYHARRDGAATRSSNFIVLLLQSFGVTVTDSNDIIFRLAYFERKHQFYGLADLTAEMSRHYTSQVKKQIPVPTRV